MDPNPPERDASAEKLNLLVGAGGNCACSASLKGLTLTMFIAGRSMLMSLLA